MAAGKPIVAARAAAVPEVVRHGLLVEPGNAEALADAILRLYRDPDLRATLGKKGSQDVEEFAMLRVGRQFLRALARIVPGIEVAERPEVEHAS